MYSNEINESEFFEENDLYIDGNVFKANLSKIESNFSSLGELFEKVMKEEAKKISKNNISVNEIRISNLEDQIEEIIEKTTNDIIKNKKKQLFVLDKSKEEKNNYTDNNKKGNYLRNEAKVLEEKIKSIHLPEYSEIKKEKYKDCELSSYHFFKNFCKKEVGKENNYIFNYRDNYLNDMTKIDQLFFKDYFKPTPVPPELSHLLVYEFSIYHPTKNIKTQQISILSNGTLADLKDKIYCVLDEIQTNSKRAFFFIENIFYNYLPKENDNTPIKTLEYLSLPISENRLKKLTMKDLENDNRSYTQEEQIEKSKFIYNKSIYSNEESQQYIKKFAYENLDMEDTQISSIPLRIGYPYLFRHIESCDHMIILNDIREIDKYDNFKVENGQVKKNNIAMVTYQKKVKRRKCDACLFYYATMISINDLAMGDVSHALFLCEYCVTKLHSKDVNEKILGNLKIIPYFHD